MSEKVQVRPTVGYVKGRWRWQIQFLDEGWKDAWQQADGSVGTNNNRGSKLLGGVSSSRRIALWRARRWQRRAELDIQEIFDRRAGQPDSSGEEE